MTESRTPVEVLSRSILFYGTAWPALEELVTHMKVEQLDAGKTLVREGDLVSGLYVILDGTVEINKSGVPHIAELESGNFFGEISLFGQSICATANVATLKPTKLALITRDVLNLWLKMHGEAEVIFFRNLAVELCNRLYTTTERFMLGYPTGKGIIPPLKTGP